jgi:phenylacetate-CoA ligase
MELSVLVPSLNEEENVPELVARVANVFEDHRLRKRGGAELVLVNDGSTDATWSIMTAQQATHAFVVPMRHRRNAGLAAAWRTAIARAQGRLVCIIDADLQYRPEDILALYEALERSGADLAQGFRAQANRERGTRYLLSRGLHHLLNYLFSMQVEDNKSGFLLCRREIFTHLLDYRGNYSYWQIFVGVAARAHGYSSCQVQTAFEPRLRCRSFLGALPVLVVLRASVDVVRAVREYGPHRLIFVDPERYVSPEGEPIDYPVEAPQDEDLFVRATAHDALTRLHRALEGENTNTLTR